jgi:hypothetical protein
MRGSLKDLAFVPPLLANFVEFRTRIIAAVAEVKERCYVACGKILTTGGILKLVVCILLRVLGQVQGFRLTQHWFEYFI